MLNGSLYRKGFLELQAYNFSVTVLTARVLFVVRATHRAKQKLTVPLTSCSISITRQMCADTLSVPTGTATGKISW